MSRSTTKKLFASLAILAAVSVFVSFGVFSAFSSTQTNSSTLKSSKFSLAATSLLDDLTGLIPGDTITRCMKAVMNSDTPAAVTMAPSISDAASTNKLDGVMAMSVEEVTGFAGTETDANIKSCTPDASGTVANLRNVVGTLASPVLGSALANSYNLPNSSGSTTAGWSGNGSNETHYYRVRVTLPSAVTNPVYADHTATAAVNITAAQIATGSAK